jgi:hypothetical protein
MEDWLPAGSENIENGQEYPQRLVLYFQMQISLAKIVQRILDELCSPKKLQYPLRRKAQVDALNLELFRWEASLDHSLHWNSWQTNRSSMCLSTAVLQ